jgi:hypothetical protein
MELREVARALWWERQLLELLQLKLETQRLMADGGSARWLVATAREVELAADELKKAEMARAISAEAVAGALGLPADVTLLELAEVCPQPWDSILLRHRDGLIEAAEAVDREARAADAALAGRAAAIGAGPVLATSP